MSPSPPSLTLCPQSITRPVYMTVYSFPDEAQGTPTFTPSPREYASPAGAKGVAGGRQVRQRHTEGSGSDRMTRCSTEPIPSTSDGPNSLTAQRHLSRQSPNSGATAAAPRSRDSNSGGNSPSLGTTSGIPGAKFRLPDAAVPTASAQRPSSAGEARPQAEGAQARAGAGDSNRAGAGVGADAGTGERGRRGCRCRGRGRGGAGGGGSQGGAEGGGRQSGASIPDATLSDSAMEVARGSSKYLYGFVFGPQRPDERLPRGASRSPSWCSPRDPTRPYSASWRRSSAPCSSTTGRSPSCKSPMLSLNGPSLCWGHLWSFQLGTASFEPQVSCLSGFWWWYQWSHIATRTG